jgi:hypothetical protein
MATPEESAFSHFLSVLIAAAFGAWAWVVKVAADRHLKSQDHIHKKLEHHSNRITRLETKLELEDNEAEDDR